MDRHAVWRYHGCRDVAGGERLLEWLGVGGRTGYYEDGRRLAQHREGGRLGVLGGMVVYGAHLGPKDVKNFGLGLNAEVYRVVARLESHVLLARFRIIVE